MAEAPQIRWVAQWQVDQPVEEDVALPADPHPKAAHHLPKAHIHVNTCNYPDSYPIYLRRRKIRIPQKNWIFTYLHIENKNELHNGIPYGYNQQYVQSYPKISIEWIQCPTFVHARSEHTRQFGH